MLDTRMPHGIWRIIFEKTLLTRSGQEPYLGADTNPRRPKTVAR